MNNKKILFINFGGIGDEILFFPTIQSVKNKYKNSEITLVLEPRSKSAKNLTDLIDKVITCDIKSKHKYFNVFKLLWAIRKNKYDIVISSGGTKFVSILLFLTGIKERYGFYSGKLSEKLLTNTVKINKAQYAAKMYHDLAYLVNHYAGFDNPNVVVDPESLTWALKQFEKDEKPVVLIHPGVSLMSIDRNIIKFWESKCWSDLIVELIKTKKYKVVLVGGPDDKRTIQEIRINVALNSVDKEYFVDLYGKTENISQLAGLVRVSDLIVCADSAPMHIGVGVGSKVVAIFGPTNDEILVPENKNISVAKVDGLSCRPCLWDKRKTTCDTLECLNIPVESVFEKIEKLLKQKNVETEN